MTFVALVALAVLAGRGGGIELEQEREKRGPDDEGWERRPTSESPYPEVRALTDDQRDAVTRCLLECWEVFFSTPLLTPYSLPCHLHPKP